MSATDISENIRNFCIIAHIDHGKSTLADRLLERTGTLTAREMREQVMDGMELERERGITIKAKAVRMTYTLNHQPYVLNLIDTPGHVDFTYEVSRALAACEGALLVVDATQGVEAQTMANATLARDGGLKIIPVINKVDLPAADPDGVAKQIREVLDIHEPALLASAKTGLGTDEVLRAIVERFPPPKPSPDASFSALVFDSVFDPFRGVVAFVKVLSGRLQAGGDALLMATREKISIEEIGYLQFGYSKQPRLASGDVGYVMTGLKDLHALRVGDTITDALKPVPVAHPGYRELKPFVFAGIYPINPADYDALKKAIEKLHLTDSSLFYAPETSSALGFGFRMGFLGLLHLEIVKERLEREFELSLIATAPNVIYRVATVKGEKREVDNPSDFPAYGEITQVEEPYVNGTIILPTEYVGSIMQLCQDRRGIYETTRYLTPQRAVLTYLLPLAEIISDFYDQLKSVSRGYASFDYEHVGYLPGDLVRMEILVNGEPLDALSCIAHEVKSHSQARKMAEKLKELIPRHMFEIPIQVRVQNKIVARETVRAMRKDVLAKCYGGDISRKRKLLEKQKEGKKRMKQFGAVEIPQEAFMAVLKLNEE